jgi:hypothetical protein
MLFHVKVYRDGSETLVACCDEEIRGKKFTEGELVLDVAESFYCDELMDVPEVSSLMKKATILNIVGEEIVKLAIKEGIIQEQSVLRVKGVPHAQMVRM